MDVNTITWRRCNGWSGQSDRKRARSAGYGSVDVIHCSDFLMSLCRCLYLGQAFAGAGRTAEAHAVLGLAVTEADAALTALNKIKGKQKQVRGGRRERGREGVKEGGREREMEGR